MTSNFKKINIVDFVGRHNPQAWGVVVNLTVGRHRFGEPNVTADDGMMPYCGLPAENGGLGIDGHIVFDVRVAFDTLDGPAVFVAWKAQRAQSDALIDFHMVADDGRLADHHARTVVDKESLPDPGPGMDVDAGVGVRPLRHHSGKKRNAAGIKGMGDSMRGNGFHKGITDHHLRDRAGGRVAFVSGLEIRHQRVMNFRHFLNQFTHGRARFFGPIVL